MDLEQKNSMPPQTITTGLYKRSYFLLAFVFFAFVFLSFRILALQTDRYESYQKAVISQMTTQSVIPADRGDIYDTNGVLLATDITVYRVFISPKDIQASEVENADTLIASKLSEILGVSYDSIMTKVGKINRQDETIAKNVSGEDVQPVREFIDKYELHNEVHIQPTSKRFYCYDNLASSVLGFTGTDNNGLYGLEYQYEEKLAGTNGIYITARDSYGNEMPTEYESYIEAEDGLNIVTTLDMFIQYELENQLAATLADNGASEKVCGIVMDVKTGAILGMATSPDFNCNDPWSLDDYFLKQLESYGYEEDSEEYKKEKSALLQNSWSNKCITSTYMPGSTFKVLTTAMCLEEKVVSVGENFFCKGSFLVPGYSRPIHCHKTTGHGAETFAQGLQQSCNPVFMTIALRLGSAKFYDYFEAFGFLEKTGVDLPGEGNSIFHKMQNFNQVELATASFGQNFTVTPLQQIRGISTVANGGYLVTPHLVKEMTDSEGNVVYSYDEKTSAVRQVISEDVCNTITQILEEGVSGNGGAKNAYVAGYRVAAKTGTTEKIDKKDESGATPYRVGSCVAYAPAEDPQVAVLIMVDEPNKGSVYGSIVAAPYVANVMSAILPYMGIEAVYTESELEKLEKKVPNYVGWSIEDAKASLNYQKLDYEIVGDGNVVKSMVPKGGTSMKKDGKIYIYSGDAEPENNIKVPDVMGKTATVANLMLVNSKLNVKITGSTNYEGNDGSAVVVSQSPAAGEKVSKGTVVTVEFRYLDGTD